MLRRSLLCRLLAVTRVLRADDGGGVFERYTEIDNSNEKRMSALKAVGMFEDEWIATEKVHGANFGVYSMDYGKSVRYAKRSGLMPPNEHFFGYHGMIPDLVRYSQKIRELLLKSIGENPHTIIMNGELFGGKYDHPSVPKVRRTVQVGGKQRPISAVQTDAFPQYSPDLHFYAFDIKFKMHGDDMDCSVLTYDEATRIFEQVPGLLYAKAIIRGPMSKVSAFDVERFQTTIPPLVGMGNFPLRGNWAEGLVVKHAKRGKPGFDPKGLTILKIKCTAFQEISTDKLQGPRVDQMEGVRRQSIEKSGVQLPDVESVIRDPAQLKACQHLLNHVCDNRLKSVLSKIGTEPFESREMTAEKLATLLAEDALKDFLKEADPSVVNMPIITRRDVVKYTVFHARKLVYSQWQEIIKREEENVG